MFLHCQESSRANCEYLFDINFLIETKCLLEYNVKYNTLSSYSNESKEEITNIICLLGIKLKLYNQ